jgi:hypothetical protein
MNLRECSFHTIFKIQKYQIFSRNPRNIPHPPNKNKNRKIEANPEIPSDSMFIEKQYCATFIQAGAYSGKQHRTVKATTT